MVAIGDSEGTVSIMQLCKPLYEPAPKEKETMGAIFERETRREKNLEVARRLAEGDPKKKGTKSVVTKVEDP
jgi:dynein intermediate chain 2